MNATLFLPFISFLINGFIWVYVFALRKKSRANTAYLIYSFFLEMWLIFNFIIWSPISNKVVLSLVRINSVWWLPVCFLFLNFTYAYLRLKRGPIFYILLAFTVSSIAMSLSTDMVLSGYIRYQWGVNLKPGILFIPAITLVMFIPTLLSVFLFMGRMLKAADSYQRNQIFLIVIGTILSFSIGVMSDMVLPLLTGNTDLVQIAPSATMVQSLFIFAAIIRYRFLSIGVEEAANVLFDNLKDGVVLFNQNGFMVQINGAARELLHVGGDDLDRTDIARVIPAYQFDREFRGLETQIGAGSGERYLSLTQTQISGHNISAGKILIIRDITERKLAEQNAQKTSRHFRTLVEYSSDIVMITADDGTILYTSPSVERLLGYSQEQTVGVNVYSYFHPDDVRPVKDLFRRGSRGDAYVTFESRFKHQDGRWFYLESISRSMPEISELAGCYITNSRDITDRKNAELVLRASEDQLRRRNEEMTRELENARKVQNLLLTGGIPTLETVAVDYRFFPLDAIGGDFFSFGSTDNRNLGIFVGDVAGHGVSAALYLTLLKSLTDKLFAVHGNSPGRFLEELNRELTQEIYINYVTALYGYFNMDRSGAASFIFSKGGHPHPIIYRRENGATEYLEASGMLLGWIKAISFDEVRVGLNRGDRIIFYTDGIVESMNPAGEFLGYDRLAEIVRRANSRPLLEVLDAVLTDVEAYRAGRPPDDDAFIACVEVI
ncbi:MAG: hypothetical protein A2176_06550 [Spirochaetes bacterium RBG_13_51_14]|nr:MAG: hypothetical protein A2176_06550 [Spirochaetes bacterium RBG_13_51_14]